MNSELRRKLASVALIVGLFVLWELLCLIFHVSDVILPRPSQVFVTLWQRAPALWPHTVQTLYTTMLGFVLGVAIGVVIGVIIGWSKLAYDVAYPLLVGFSSVPKVAVVPIFVLYFGSGTVPAVHHRADHVPLSRGGERRDRARHHRARARGRHEGAQGHQVRHPVERRAAAHDAVLLRLAESRDHARLRRLGDLRDRRVEPRHRHHDDDRKRELRRAAGVRRLFILAALGVALYAIFSLVEARVTGWAHRKTEFAMG